MAQEGLPRKDYQGSSCIPRGHEFCVSPLHQSRAWMKPRSEQILFYFHFFSGWFLPDQAKQSEYVPEELGLAIWQRTFHRKSCRMLLSSVPKEGTIPVLPAPLQPPPLQGQSFLHPKIPTGKPPRIFKDAAARVLAFKMLLSPRAAWC
ncbi:hypothetical protein RLOC_00011355 [Lonchura striata]|uniref:Uncharacterized protein n=1 Tax=Lonchura striata TaxID=40157 RepID=A0A218UEJ4_9PASE|nr:hypothetical protein RLOC_00011355 [Lonchura striata domestica]